MRKKYLNTFIHSVLILVLSACGQFRNVPDYSKITKVLNNKINSKHFIFHLSEGDSVNVDWQEQYYEWLASKLKLDLQDKVYYYKYADNNQILDLLGYKGNALVRFGRIHSIWPSDNHEVVHVLVGTNVGMPPKLFSEGIAVAHQTNPIENDTVPKWGNMSIDKVAAKFVRESKIPQLDSLLNINDFMKFDADITYPISGSFVKYLITEYGLELLYDFFRESNWDDNPKEMKKIFNEIYRIELIVVWNSWLKEISVLS